jgi:hypothetical protein
MGLQKGRGLDKNLMLTELEKEELFRHQKLKKGQKE